MSDHASHVSELLDRLLTEGVLVERADGQLSLSDAFAAALERHRDEMDDGEESVAEALTDETSPELVAKMRALQEFDESLTDDEALQIGSALRRAIDSLPDSGVPDGFVPLAGPEIGAFLRRHPVSVLFCWEPESAVCRAARQNLEAVLPDESVPDGVGYGAVHVPDCPDRLREEFDVWLPPTTLFCSGSTVESRLVRAHPQVSIRREVQVLAADLR